MSRTAVILFNLGGPDRPEAVEPFLFNLFNDRAIIGLPQPFRRLLARLVSRKRAPVAREIYEHLGGRSPLLDNTMAQASALERALGEDVRCFVAMRYWHPFAAETVAAVAEWNPDEIVLLPLYPQYSTTTVGSSFDDWGRACARAGFRRPTRSVCCYYDLPGFVEPLADATRTAAAGLGGPEGCRILFSAHGLPEKIIRRGDPYQWQVEATATAIADRLGDGFDTVVCYQSRVGPLKWIGPSTEEELDRAAADGKAVVIVPVAFVSEHSETLVELDMEYRNIAENIGIKGFSRVCTVGVDPRFVAGLADLVREAPGTGAGPGTEPGAVAPFGGTRRCPPHATACPCWAADGAADGPAGGSAAR